MNFAYSFSGGTPVIKKYRVASASTAKAGGYVTAAIDGGTGVVLGLTTAVALQVGYTLDAATGSATPTADSTAVTSCVVNPDAVYRLLIVKGATGGQVDMMTESAGGSKIANTITTGDTAPSSPDMNEGSIVCISGANKGQTRKCTSTAATIATNIEGWVNNNAIGDQFILLPWNPGDGATGDKINLTTDLAQARADIASDTGAWMRVVEIQVDQGSTYASRNRSYVFADLGDLIWRQIITVAA